MYLYIEYRYNLIRNYKLIVTKRTLNNDHDTVQN